jgi:uncharacterized membrane protein
VKPWLLHPVAVHFPIVLLTTGWLAGALRRRAAWAEGASTWGLWLGTAGAWAALGLGLLAERTAPHVPPAWETLNRHQTLGWWTVALFTVLSLWHWRAKERWRTAFLALWLAACGVLLATARQGGELVYTHGMGVVSGEEG